jgi:hypothetical protein
MLRKSLQATGLLVAIILALPGYGLSQTPPPGTDIWVMELNEGGGGVSLGDPTRATDRTGYDNQPFFARGGDYLLFTSIDEAGQADIYRYVFDDGSRMRVTRTAPESEYSATIMPSGSRFSAIRVEADSTQRLWSFTLTGSDPRVLFSDIAPVGYHAWIDANTVVLFVLGSPATLHVADWESLTSEVVTEGIGRSLHKVPGKRAASFLQWEGSGRDRTGIIKILDLATREIEVVGEALPGNEFYAWTRGGLILSGEGTKIYMLVPGDEAGWQEVADLGSAGISGITRLAVSPEGDRLAVVGNR